MQQLLRYGIMCSVVLMIVLHPIISRAQSPQLQEVIKSGEAAIATAEEIEAVLGIKIPEVDAARASLDRLVEAERAGEDIQFAELQTGFNAIGGALNELRQIVEVAQFSVACTLAQVGAATVCVAAAIECVETLGLGCGAGAELCGQAVTFAASVCAANP